MADKNRAEEEPFKSGGPEGHYPHHGVRAPKDTTHSSTRVQGLCKHGALQGNKDLLANIAGDPSVHMQGKHSRMEAQEVSEEQMQHIRAEAEQARREGRCGPHEPPAAQTMMQPVEGSITGGPMSGHATYSTEGGFGQYNPLRNQTGTFGTSASMQDSNAPSTTMSHSVKPHCGGLGSVPGGGGATGGSMH